MWALNGSGRLSWPKVKAQSLQAFKQCAAELNAAPAGQRRALALERHDSVGAMFVSMLSMAPAITQLKAMIGSGLDGFPWPENNCP